MNFTREPIIQTIITPKDGFKILVRNSKGASHDEYYVEALELVSFGNAFFYRNLEKAKQFLLPVTDYEVIEMKETRVVLKNISVEKPIKIGGGKEVKAIKEEAEEEAPRSDKRRERRKSRRKRPSTSERDETKTGEVIAPLPMLSALVPPPATLISESFMRARPPAEPIFVEKKEGKAEKEPTLIPEEKVLEKIDEKNSKKEGKAEKEPTLIPEEKMLEKIDEKNSKKEVVKEIKKDEEKPLES